MHQELRLHQCESTITATQSLRKSGMKIGELAKITEVLVETIRYYEQEKLLMAPARTPGNYRNYGPEHLARLLFVRHCRSLDITHDEIRSLLSFQDSPNDNCGKIDLLLDTQIAKVDNKIDRLMALQKQLTSLRSLCEKERAVKDCQIMQKLACRAGANLDRCSSVEPLPESIPARVA